MGDLLAREERRQRHEDGAGKLRGEVRDDPRGAVVGDECGYARLPCFQLVSELPGSKVELAVGQTFGRGTNGNSQRCARRESPDGFDGRAHWTSELRRVRSVGHQRGTRSRYSSYRAPKRFSKPGSS